MDLILAFCFFYLLPEAKLQGLEMKLVGNNECIITNACLYFP